MQILTLRYSLTRFLQLFLCTLQGSIEEEMELEGIRAVDSEVHLSLLALLVQKYKYCEEEMELEGIRAVDSEVHLSLLALLVQKYKY